MKPLLIIVFLLIVSPQLIASYYYDINGEKIQINSNGSSIVFKNSKNRIVTFKNLISKEGIKVEDIKIFKNLVIYRLDKEISNKEILKKSDLDILETFGTGTWPTIIDKRAVVKPKQGVDINKLSEKYQFKIVEYIKGINSYIIASKRDKNGREIANMLYETGYFEQAQPDFIIMHKLKYTPNDPYFYGQWHFSNSGTLYNSKAGADIKATFAWDIEMGKEEIKIAIVDDGFDVNHPDLASKVVAYYDFGDGDNDVGNSGLAGDEGGVHGTACGGVAAGKGDNGIGITGVCPNCSIVAAKIFSSSGYGYSSADSKAILWSAGSEVSDLDSIDGVDVISCSWGFDEDVRIPYPLKSAIDWAVTYGRDGKGTVVVFASGNDGRLYNDYELEAHRDIITVGASTDQDLRSYYSNYGPKLDVLAPSSGGYNSVWTTDYRGSIGYNNNGYGDWGNQELDNEGNYTKMFGGTSSACPVVSGLAGLILSKNSDLTYLQVRAIIREATDQIGGVNYSDGYNLKYGYGRVNSFKALKMADFEIYNDFGNSCETVNDCNFNCLPENIGFPNGFCTQECSANYCPDQYYCDKLPYDQKKYCFKTCEVKQDCPQFYSCKESPYNSDVKYCQPGCSYTGCDQYLTICNSETELCEDDVDNPCYTKTCEEHSYCDQSNGECVCSYKYVFNSEGVCVENLCLNLDGTERICVNNATCDPVIGICNCQDGYKMSGNVCIKDQDDNNPICSYSNQKDILPLFYLLFIAFFIILKKYLNRIGD